MQFSKFQVFGQRCSGTNALIRLLEANFPALHLCEDTGFKHWAVPAERPIPADTLVVVIAREVQQWLRSLHRQPWHVRPEIRRLGFADFIRSEWRTIWDDDFWGIAPGHPLYGQPIEEELCPVTAAPYANPVAMRTAKLANWIATARRSPAHLLVSHADLIAEPAAIVDQVATLTGHAPVKPFAPVTTYKGEGNHAFRPRHYQALEPADRDHARDWIDPAVEATFGLPPL